MEGGFTNSSPLHSYWRRQWHPTPVLLPGKSQGRRNLGRLQSMGSLRVGHDWVTSLSLSTFMHWRRKWQQTPVFLPGESQRQRSLVAAIYGVTQSRTRLKRLSSSSIHQFWFAFSVTICYFPTILILTLLFDFICSPFCHQRYLSPKSYYLLSVSFWFLWSMWKWQPLFNSQTFHSPLIFVAGHRNGVLKADVIVIK